MTDLVTRTLPSPVGDLTLAASATALVAVRFPGDVPVPSAGVHAPGIHPTARRVARERHAILDHAARELTEYFAGRRKTFTVPLSPTGTAFQCLVWETLSTIPFGATWSYGDLARAIRRPAASRAVGAANGRNPLPIIVPCHRVIGANGTLTGFGGGLPTKKWLLAHESAQLTL